VIADHHQRWNSYVTKPVRAFKIVARDADMDELRELGVGRPGEPEG